MREVYTNPPYMRRYMEGVLISSVMWCNHTEAFNHYVHRYLPVLPRGADHLEVGPGHGSLLYFAAERPEIGSVEGWDASPTSIENTRAALDALGVSRSVPLTLQNPFDGRERTSGRQYDSIVLSEILEHLEDPLAALRAAKSWIKPGGRVWVNVPANSLLPIIYFSSIAPTMHATS